MAECSFTFPVTRDPQEVFLAVHDALLAQGGTIQGNASSGTAVLPSPLGSVDIAYTLSASTLAVDVLSKPFLVSCAQIQSSLADAIAASPSLPTQPAAAATATPAPTSSAAAPASKVLTLDTQYIYGSVPPAASSSSGLWYGLAAVAALWLWWRR